MQHKRSLGLTIGLALFLVTFPAVAHAAPLIIAWLSAYIAGWLATLAAYAFTTLVSVMVSKSNFGTRKPPE